MNVCLFPANPKFELKLNICLGPTPMKHIKQNKFGGGQHKKCLYKHEKVIH